MENKTSKVEANSLQHSNEHFGCSNLLRSGSVLLVWWQGMVYHLGSYSFLVRTEIKKNPSEVRHKQKVLTLVISGCFMWLVQNYWPWYCSNTAILLTWEEPSLVSFISATAKLISKFSSAETVDRQEISWKLGHLGRTPSPKYWDLVQTQGCSAALNGG